MSGTANYGLTDGEKLNLVRKHLDILPWAEADFVDGLGARGLTDLKAVEIHRMVEAYDQAHPLIQEAERKEKAEMAAHIPEPTSANLDEDEDLAERDGPDDTGSGADENE